MRNALLIIIVFCGCLALSTVAILLVDPSIGSVLGAVVGVRAAVLLG